MAQFPNPNTQFKPGVSGNPGGKSSEHRKAEVRAAEAAAKVQADLVEALARLSNRSTTRPATEARHLALSKSLQRRFPASQSRSNGF